MWLIKLAFMLTILSILSASIYATKIISTEKLLYTVTPENQTQLAGIVGVIFSHPAVIIWNGVGNLGDPVRLLTSVADMEKYSKDVLTPLGLKAEIVYCSVRIEFDNEQREQNKSPPPPVVAYSPSYIKQPATNLIPMVKIPNTNIYTGIFYTIKHKKFPNALLVKNHQNHIVIDWNSDRLNEYKKGGSKEKHAQWMFTNSERGNYYQWENRELFPPRGITAVGLRIANSFLDYVTVFSDPSHIKRLTTLANVDREYALWRPRLLEENYYSLFVANYAYEGRIANSGIKADGGSEYLCLDLSTDKDGKYNKGGEWYDSLLYEFTPYVELFGRVTQFDLLEAPDELLKAHTKRGSESSITKDTIANPSSSEITRTIELSFTRTSTFSFGFEQSFKIFASAEFEAGIPFVGKAKTTAGFEAELKANQQITKSEETTKKETSQVKVGPYTTVVVSSATEWIQDLELPFNATMVVTGETIRRRADTKAEVTGGLTGEFIWEYMKMRDTTYESAQLLELRADSIVLNLRGKFKGTYGYRGRISTEEVVKPPTTTPAIGTEKSTGANSTGLTPAEIAKQAYCNS